MNHTWMRLFTWATIGLAGIAFIVLFVMPWYTPARSPLGILILATAGLSALRFFLLERRLCTESRSNANRIRILYEIVARLKSLELRAREVRRRVLTHLEIAEDRGHTSDGFQTKLGLNRESETSLRKAMVEISQTLRSITDALIKADAETKELATSAEETAYSISRLDRFLQDMADRGRELEASTDAANRVALEGAKVVEEMARENEAIIAAVKEAANSVEGLGRWSREVGKILEVIRDIADETNLLSLNAAIIAAQAGEHGKAFGVVAEEIRGLAERTSSSTQEISDLVKTLQKNVSDVTRSMKKSLQRVERGEILTRNAGSVLEKVFESFESSRNLAKEIAVTTLEHKMESSHVVRSIQRVSEIAKQLESEKFSKWSRTEESAAVATAVAMVARRSGRASHSANVNSHDLGTIQRSENSESIASAILSHVETSRDQSVGTNILKEISLDVLERITNLANFAMKACRQLDFKPEGLRRCWEVTDCSPECRQKCKAYRASEPRCFLLEHTRCSLGEDGAGHAKGECHTCPAFEEILRSVGETTCEVTK